MYRVPFERFDYGQGDWIFGIVEYDDSEFAEEARRMKRREIQQDFYEDSEGQLDFDELDLAVEEALARMTDEEILEQYKCFKVS